MASLKPWPILNFIPSDMVPSVKKAFVFGVAGQDAFVMLKTKDIYGFGLNGLGCLGISTSDITRKPVKIEALCDKEIFGISYGSGKHVIALTEDGELYSWGRNNYGQLGHSNKSDKNLPILVPMPKKVKQVVCGNSHSLAVTVDGELYSWGCNSNTQLGLGGSDHQDAPKMVEGNLKPGSKKVVEVACGQHFSLALVENGELYSWGYNGYGQLGLGHTNNQNVPVRVPENDLIFTKIACGTDHVLALTDTGTLYSWGKNNHGQLGSRATNNSSKPQKVVCCEERLPEGTDERQLLTGTCNVHRWYSIAAHHEREMSAGITIDGKVFIWGQCHNQAVLSPCEVLASNLAEAFAPGGMPQNFFIDGGGCESTSVKSTVAKAFDDETSSDMKFIIEGKTIHAHRAVLKIRCAYFRNMMHSHWDEAGKSEIEVSEFSYDVYYAFLRYLYTDEVEIDAVGVIGLLDLAESFCEAGLKSKCEAIMMNGVTVENLGTLIGAAVKYKAKELEEFCFRFAMHRLTAVTLTDSFGELDPNFIKDFFRKAAKKGAFIN